VTLFATIVVAVRSPPTFAKENQRLAFSKRLREEWTRTGRLDSPAVLAREINLHLRPSEQVHPSSCRKWLHGQSIPTQEKLQVLARILQVSPAWLRYGQRTELQEPAPAPAPLSPAELSLLEVWRQLNRNQQRAVRLLIGQMLNQAN
jgi:transcriptional regulator with XRE-family HTH domain